VCCKEPQPDEFGYLAEEEDEYGDWWTYCKECDVWTSHPQETKSDV